jgi:hypothetical protein
MLHKDERVKSWKTAVFPVLIYLLCALINYNIGRADFEGTGIECMDGA